jgi:2-polyprenyl-6-methoxyphenol hydroxylase-like FAD-dependent oxidoreductase
LEQDAHGVTVRSESDVGATTLRGAWCIGADGARSAVRRALRLPFEGMTWDERFVATNLRFDFEADGFARATQVADPEHGAIISKIDTTGLWRYTFAESSDLPAADVAARIPARLAALLGHDRPAVVDQFSPYRMHQRVVPTMRVGRALLLGDAAHTTNPTGGFGLTSALFSSYALVPALVAVLEGADPHKLDEWSDDRRRRFVELASPQASELKRMLYSERDPQRRREDFERVRRGSEDPRLLRDRLRFTLSLRTPAS